MNYKITTSLVIITGVLGGCASTYRWHSQETVTLRIENAQDITDDLMPLLKKEYPPAKTVFTMSAPKDGVFGHTLENELRKTGYGIVKAKNTDKATKRLSYLLDELKGADIFRIGVRVEPDYRIDGLYVRDRIDGTLRRKSLTVKDSKHPISLLPKISQKKAITETERKIVSYAEPPKKHVQVARKTANEKPPYSVQFIAGTNGTDLEKHKNVVSQTGLYVATVSLNAKGSYKALRIGCTSLKEAREVMRIMQQAGYEDAFVLKRKG